MYYFDFETAAREAQISTDELRELCRIVRQEFPDDEMMHELHVLRVCMAVRQHAVKIEDILKAPSTAK